MEMFSISKSLPWKMSLWYLHLWFLKVMWCFLSLYNVSLSKSLHSWNYCRPSWIGSHLKICYCTIMYNCWVFLRWRELFIWDCRWNIKQLLGRCWISSPPQLEKLIFLYMWCPRTWCDPDLLPHQMYTWMWISGLWGCMIICSFWFFTHFNTCCCSITDALIHSDAVVLCRYLRIVKYKTAYYSFYLPVRFSLDMLLSCILSAPGITCQSVSSEDQAPNEHFLRSPDM